MTFERVIVILMAFTVVLAAEGIYYLVMYRGQRRRTELRRRLRALASEAGAGPGLVRDRRLARNPHVAQFLEGLPGVGRLERALLQTDLELTVAGLIFISVAAAAGLSGLLMLVVRGPTLPAGLVGILVGGAVPYLYVMGARARRSEKISQQLPDALDMLVRSLRAGHGISAGFRLVAQEMPSPVAVEFGRAYEEQQFGVGFRESLENMAERVPGNVDLRIFVVSAVIQRDTGGNLVEILEQIAKTIRDRYVFNGKLRALTAEGRYSGYILGGLPFACLAMVSLFNPTYLKPLGQDLLGQQIAVGGAVVWAVGVLWMKQLVKVDY